MSKEMEENANLLVEEEEEEVQIPQDNENALIQEPDPAVIEGDILTQREGEVPPEEPRELPDQYDLGHQGEYSEEVSPLVPAKTVDEAAQENEYLKSDFTNLLRKISEHPNGAKYADKLIYNILHEEQDFGEGGKYENIKVTEVLENFEEIYPDLTDTEDVSNGLTRNVSPVADTLKEFLRDRKNRENYPVLYALQDSFEGTVEAGKELAWTAPNRIGYALMETLAGVAEWGTGDFVKAYWMSEGLSKKEAEKRKKEFYDISGYGLQADKPQTVLGQLAVSGGEAGLAYFTGKRIYESIAVPIKNIVPKIAEMLATPGGKIAISEVIGGTLITSREERLAPVLQMLGVTGEGPFGNWVDYIAGSEDDSVFEERFKSFIDATYTGVGLGLVAPLVMLTGKGAYHAAKGTTEQGRKALQAGASWADQIFHNYPVEEAMRMDLGGPKVIKTEELGRIRDQAEELLLQQDTVEKTVGTGKRLLKKVLGKDPNITDDAGLIYEKPNVKPITKDKLPSEAFLTEKDIVLENVSSDKVAKKFKANRELPDNTVVEVRPTISKADVLKTEKGDQVLVTIHNPSKSESATARQGVIGYDHAVTLRNVEFKVNQDSRLKIASGEKPKHPAMVGKGKIIQTKPVFEGIEVTFNPRSDHLFRIVENGLAIRSAEEAVFFDKRVLVRGKVTYWDEASSPKPKGDVSSGTVFKYKTKQEVTSEEGTVKELLESQGHKIDDDTIQPVIKHETESFLQPIADVDFDEVILDSVSGIDGAIDFEDISKTVFNLKYVSGENRKQAIAQASVLFQKRWEKLQKTHGSTIGDAQKIRADIEHMVGPDHVDTYLKEFAGTTDALPGTMLALKQYMIEESLPFMMSSKAVATQAKQLADGTIRTMDKKLLAQYFLDTYRLMGVLEADVKLIGNVARTLEARKIALGGSDELLDNIIAGAKDGSLEGEDLLINIAQTVDKYTDVTQVLNGGRPKGKLYTLFDGLKSWAVSGLLSGIKTLAAAPVGISTYMAVKSGETWVAAGLNQTGKLLYKTTGSKILGTGDGVTFSQANAYHFGMSQALLEVFGGTGYFKRSAFGEGTRVGRTLDLGDRSSAHEMIKMFEGSKDKINVPILGEFTMAKGVNGQALDNLLGLTEHGLTGHGPKFLKFLANSAGFINGLNARIIMAEDGFFRTLLERAEMHKLSMRRAEERLRSAGKEFSHEDLMNDYFEVVKNYPEDLARIGKEEAKIGVMQETKRGGWVSTVEKFKNTASNSPKIGQNIGSNLLRTYAASKFSFIRTMANIYKQTLTERGIGKIAKTYFNEKEARRFANDPAFRQESLAKMGSGLLLTGMGAGLGWGLLKNDDTEIYMEGVDASIRGKEYMKMSQGSSFGPEIKMRNVKTGQITSIPLDRLDMGKAPLVLGAIASSSIKQAQEAFAKMPEGRALDGLRELDELKNKFALALGDMMTDLPMAQGAQETLKNLIPGFGPEWNPGKEGTSFFHGFFNPVKSGLSTLRASGKKAISDEGVRFQKHKDQKWELEPLEDWENQQYTTKGHTEEFIGVPEVGRKLGIVSDILLQLQDIGNRVSIGDYSDPENPIIGQDLYAMVDPEGNLMRYLPDPYIDKVRRAAETLLIPFSPHTLAQTNTTDLIAAFDHPYEHPKDWSTGSNYPLSAEQRYHWTVLAGRANKKTFSDPYWKDVILKERLGFYDPDTREGRANRGDVLRELGLDLEQNRMEALEEMLSLERNRAASDYIEAARLQLPPLHAKDKL